MSAIRIGTRGSPLALAQAQLVARRLIAIHGLTDDHIAISVIKTSGDRIQDRSLSEVGGKGLFTKELEDALLAHEIDLAVHSLKDMPTVLPDGLAIAAVLEREDPRDAFISHRFARFTDLPAGAVVGTSSLRRQAQILRSRPDLNVIGFRGNVETRLRKIADGVADATFLAQAGLNRLGLTTHAREIRAIDVMLPAVAQGAIAVEKRKGDERHASLIGALDHTTTRIAVACERAFLARLDGSCRTPIAGFAEFETPDRLVFRGEILTPDGRVNHATKRVGVPKDAEKLGDDAARELLDRAGPAFLVRSS